MPFFKANSTPGLERMRRLLQSPAVIVLTALGLRLATIIHERTYQNPSLHGGWNFGYEMGQIAFSLATGHGFSFLWPFARPTAHIPPVYPLLMAAVFKLFGTFTPLSAFVIYALDAALSAATCVTIFLLAKLMFGDAVGLWSAWAWALLPESIYWSTHFVWYTTLSALLLTVVFLLALRLRESTQWWKWFAVGAVWALVFLTNPSLMPFLPVAFAWLAYEHRGHLRTATALSGVAALAFLLGISPWVIRNYRVFGTPVLSRSDLGEELWAGNHEAGNGLYWMVKPWSYAELQRVGEVAYMRERQGQALQFIRAHPSEFALFTFRRIGYFWCDVPNQLSTNPDYIPFFPRRTPGMSARHAIYFGFAFLAFWGLWTAYRRKARGTALFAGLFLLYPLIYYVTHCHPRYQFPIVPEMLILAVYLLHTSTQQPSTTGAWLARRRRRSLQARPPASSPPPPPWRSNAEKDLV